MTAREILTHYAEIMRQISEGRLTQYEWVLRHGEEFRPAPLPGDVEIGVPRYCYSNVHLLCARRSDLQYVEGFCFIKELPLPINHAWAARPDSLEVIDPTCPNVPLYFGVRFSSQYRKKAYRAGVRNDCLSLIDNWVEGFPLMGKTQKELETILVKSRIERT